MKKVVHKKLVRDKIPQIIRADNAEPVIRTLSTVEYRRALLEKLVEEATELRDSDGDIDERADVAEVLKSIDVLWGYTSAEVEQSRQLKANRRGGFANKVFLEEVVLEDGAAV